MHHIASRPKPREIPALCPVCPIRRAQRRREVLSSQSIRVLQSFNASIYRRSPGSRPRKHVQPIRRPSRAVAACGGSGRVEHVGVGAYSDSRRSKVGERRKRGIGSGRLCCIGGDRRRRRWNGRWEIGLTRSEVEDSARGRHVSKRLGPGYTIRCTGALLLARDEGSVEEAHWRQAQECQELEPESCEAKVDARRICRAATTQQALLWP